MGHATARVDVKGKLGDGLMHSTVSPPGKMERKKQKNNMTLWTFLFLPSCHHSAWAGCFVTHQAATLVLFLRNEVVLFAVGWGT